MQTIVIVLDFRNAKQQMESMGEQPVKSKTFIAVFQIMQKSLETNRFLVHGVNNLVHFLVRKLACAGF